MGCNRNRVCTKSIQITQGLLIIKGLHNVCLLSNSDEWCFMYFSDLVNCFSTFKFAHLIWL